MKISNPAEAFDRYEALLTPHREAFAGRPALAFRDGSAPDPALLHLFLIYYSAFGISMTRPVESWISRAGEQCRRRGFDELGNTLIAHATHEAAHHKLMIADLWALVERWNAHSDAKIDPVTLGQKKLPESVRKYHDLHEEIITGNTPFAQIALEYEIEALSVRHGSRLVTIADKTIHDNNGGGLSFLREHAALDTAHTQLNRRQIVQLLGEHPSCLKELANTGARALAIYGQFIDECLRAALAFDSGETTHAIECRLFAPPREVAMPILPQWLLSIRKLRSQVFHDGGARPSFGPEGKSYGDPDPADLYSHHLALFDGDNPIGAARFSLIDQGSGASLIASTFGERKIRFCLEKAGFRWEDCAEASRLILHPEYRKGRTVQRLFAGLWALAAQSGAPAILAAVGTASNQDRLFAIFGAKMLDNAGSVHSALFDDKLRLALFSVDRNAPPDYPELEQMQEFIARSHIGLQTTVAA
jgi:N-acetylglutamate synthase-like GNAT family acetyltransferase